MGDEGLGIVGCEGHRASATLRFRCSADRLQKMFPGQKWHG